MPWIDIVIFVILAAYVITGLVRGFLRSSVRFGNTVIAICVGILLAPTLALLFTNVIHLDSSISQLISSSITGYCVSDTGTQINDEFLHQFAQFSLGNEYWLNYPNGVESPEFIAKLAYAITDNLIVLISFFIVFGMMRIIISCVCGFIRAINRKRAYGWVARTMGGLVSIFEGICVIWVAFCVVSALLPALPAQHDLIRHLLLSNPVSNWIFGISNDFYNGILLPWLLRFY